MAAGYGTSPAFVFSGTDDQGRYFQFVELLFGGIPGRPIADGLDGHSWWPMFRTTPSEYTESYYPVRIERYIPVRDSGGAGLHRGGTGIEKHYFFTGAGAFTVHDDRALISPWGIGGGKAGGLSYKLLIKADGTEIELPSKVDAHPVEAGDRLIFRTAGAGGHGDPLERPAKFVLRDVQPRPRLSRVGRARLRSCDRGRGRGRAGHRGAARAPARGARRAGPVRLRRAARGHHGRLNAARSRLVASRSGSSVTGSSTTP